MAIEIRHRNTDDVIFSGEFASMKDAVEEAVKLGVDLSYADLSRADLSAANLSGARLSCADLKRANLIRTDLTEADLKKADLYKACLYKTDLSKADLRAAGLSRVHAKQADFSGANLYCTLLSYANLSEADLERATLTDAILIGANLAITDVMSFSLGQHTGFVHFGGQYPDGSICRIGCEEHSLGFWLENYEEIGKKHGYSDKQIALYGDVLAMLDEHRERT